MSATPHTTADRIEMPRALARLLEWARPRRSALAWIALGVMLVATGAFLFHESRGATLWRDEWDWALHRRGNDLGAFLRPHFGHFSLVPIAIYRVLFATAGLTHFAVYRVMVIAAHLACVTLVYVYARPRVGRFLGLLAAALLLFLGAASQNILWPFQVGWLISLGAGVGALLALDRRDRAGDVAASLLLALSLASSGVGIPVALGVIVDVLGRRRRLRDLWILATPLILYGIWWLAYQTSQTSHWRHDLWLTPGYVAGGLANSISSLSGLAGATSIAGPLQPTQWGTPLLVTGLLAAGWRLFKLRTVPVRVLTLVTILLAFWVVTGLGRGFFGGPTAGRYIYVGALFVLLLAVELARGAVVGWQASLIVAVLVAGAAVSGLNAYRQAGADYRSQTQLVKAELGAMEIARPLVKPSYVSRGSLFNEITAGPYFATVKALGGTPAASPVEIATYPELIRMAADIQLATIHQVRLESSTAAALGAPPKVESVAGGTVSSGGGCVRYVPAAFTPGAPAAHDLSIVLPASGVRIKSQGGVATVGLRRFADEFQPLGRVAADTAANLRIGPDKAGQPWHVQVAPTARAVVCSIG